MKQNSMENSQSAKIEVIKNNLSKLDNLKGEEHNPEFTTWKSGIDNTLKHDREYLNTTEKTEFVKGGDFKDEADKENFVTYLKESLERKVNSRELIINKSPLKRVQLLREDFLSKLDNNTLEYFSTAMNSSEMGVNAEMYPVDKNNLIYSVNSVVRVDKDVNLYRTEGQEKLYAEKITITEKQRKNFLDFLEKEIPNLEVEIKDGKVSYRESLAELKEALEILKNGGVK